LDSISQRRLLSVDQPICFDGFPILCLVYFP